MDYSDERGPRETLYLIVDPEAAAFAVLNPTLDSWKRYTRASPQHSSHISLGHSIDGYACTTTTMLKNGSKCFASGTRVRRMRSNTRYPM